jgi:exosome complex component RRP42
MDIESYLRRDYITNLVKKGKRLDNRAFDEYRKITVEKGYVKDKAAGSALVKLGDTKVLSGISMDVGEPYPDSPKSGVMIISTEMRPMAAPNFETGPPDEHSIELARVVDRGIRESGAIDVEKLFIEEGKVWVVFIDVHMLDHSGNLIDAAGLAAMAALLDTRMPKYEDGKVIRGEFKGKLPLTCTPIPCTSVKIGDNMLLDPELDEEYAMTSRLTVTTTNTLNAMQKGGAGAMTEDDVMKSLDMSFKHGKEIRKMLEG